MHTHSVGFFSRFTHCVNEEDALIVCHLQTSRHGIL